jgi:hypothetical protein
VQKSHGATLPKFVFGVSTKDCHPRELTMPALDSSALSEEDLIDDADLDTLVREAIAQVCFKADLHAATSPSTMCEKQRDSINLMS